ncbi:hypothetical protein NX779_02620 [Mycoplasma cottewii]|uniref:Uncharacterized protein n=1 Tax=Mycoplasma cottewii TaxID=51364 RepID=A0ABY5TYR2_9MOLU|nr:hypothetical protein [Mycoplasma cottewii]UWD34686.1 hypothetical protein NX779_02620 [Mycoplasma cottewii]
MKKFLSVLTASAILLTTGSFALINNNNSKNNIILKQTTNIASNSETTTETKKNLSELVVDKNIGEILKDSDQEIIVAINRKNKNASLDINQLKIEKNQDGKKAKISAKDDSKNYQGSVEVEFIVNKEAKFDLKDLIIKTKDIKIKLPKNVDIKKAKKDILRALSIANIKTTSALDANQLEMTKAEITFEKEKYKSVSVTFKAIEPQVDSNKKQSKQDEKKTVINYKGEITAKFNIEIKPDQKPDNKGVIIALSIASASVLAGTAILVTKKYKKAPTN